MRNNFIPFLFLFWVIQSCQSNQNNPFQPESQAVSESSATNQAPGEVPVANSLSVSSQTTVRLDTGSLARFDYNWYLFAFGEEYHWFQKDAVQFPFQTTFQDSLGNIRRLLFQSLDSMVAWRMEHSALFGNGQKETDRVIAGGYPDATFDVIPFEHFEHIPPSNSILLTYVEPFFKSDYYFKKENGRWIAFKSSHFQYSSSGIKNLEDKKFEDFLLRFSSDLSYRLQHTTFPLKDKNRAAGETERVSYRTRQQGEKDARAQSAHGFKYMTIYPDYAKNRAEPDMYLTVKNEGGGCGWSHFSKLNNKWMLVETLNCSN